VVGKVILGPMQDKHHETLTDAVMYERIPVVILISAMFAIGMFPGWISTMIGDSVMPVITQFLR
jgi:NADH-quinone oxidoreductase subunit M